MKNDSIMNKSLSHEFFFKLLIFHREICKDKNKKETVETYIVSQSFESNYIF